MDRRRFLVTSLVGAVAAPLRAGAQPAPRTPKIGFLSPASSSSIGPYRLERFRDSLREYGYIDSTNVTIEPRFADGYYDRLPGLAAELVTSKVDVIVAWTTPAALVAQRSTASIPIIFTSVSDPVRTGLVASLARPGGNVTGYTDITADLVSKRLGLLKELMPQAARVGVLSNSANPGVAIAKNELEAAARQLGLELYAADIRNAGDLESAFTTLAKAHVGSVVVVADSLLSQHSAAIARLAVNRRLPLMGWSVTWPKTRALFSYGAASIDVERRAAAYVAKILRGANPADLPVEQSATFELVINLKTAKALGLTIPPSLLARADQVIE
jgi:putative ABC transport system substrate-binding protein